MTEGDRRFWPVVPGYVVVAEIGRGGFASVYEATQESIGRKVALKVLAPTALGADMERRFRSECRTVGELSWHPNVVALYDAGFCDDGRPYLAMELLPGGSLGDRVRTMGALPQDEVSKAGLAVAEALVAAHDHGVVHRDIKPDNLLIGRNGAILLSDFGIATISDATQSGTGSFSGTYAYCAPEVHKGLRAGPAADIYSLGATLYTLASGRAAFLTRTDDAPSAVILRVVSEPPPPLPPTVARPLVAVIERAMAKDPADRFESASEMRTAIIGASSPGSVPAPAPSAPEDLADPTMVRAALVAPEPEAATCTPAGPVDGPTQARPKQGSSPDDEGTISRTPVDGTPPPPERSNPSAPGKTPRRRRRIVALVGLALLIAALGIAGALTIANGGGREDEDVLARDPRADPNAAFASDEGSFDESNAIAGESITIHRPKVVSDRGLYLKAKIEVSEGNEMELPPVNFSVETVCNGDPPDGGTGVNGTETVPFLIKFLNDPDCTSGEFYVEATDNGTDETVDTFVVPFDDALLAEIAAA